MWQTLVRSAGAGGADTRTAPGQTDRVGGRHGRAGLAMVGILIVTVLAVTAVLVIHLREAALDTAEANIVRINYALAESLERLFQTIDLTLVDIAREVATAPSPSFASSEVLRDRLRARMAGLPASQRLAVFDATGRVINGTSAWPKTATSIADRPYFADQRDHPDLGMTVSEPLQSRADRQWTFILSRRISGADGTFLGLVSTAMNLTYLDDMFAAVVPETGARVTLLRKDMMMLFRHPYVPDLYGRNFASTPTYQGIFADGRTAGSGRFFGTVDQMHRVAAARVLLRYPFVVSVAVPEATILAAWRQMAAGVGVAALAVVFGLVGLLELLWRQSARRSAAEAALAETRTTLAEERRRLWSVVDAASDGFWEWHLDTGMVDWSERCCALMDLPAAGGVLHIEQVLAMVVAEDRERYRAAVRRLVDTDQPLEIEARWHTVGGSRRWIASRARVVRNGDGRPVRMIGANTDITERKVLEAELSES